MDFSHHPELLRCNISKSIIINVDGNKIGIVGFLTTETEHLSEIGKIKFLDEVKALKEESERLHSTGVNIIIALGHSGIEKEKIIAKEVPLVDLVIGGHSNTFLYNGAQPDLESPEGPYPIVIEQYSGKKVPLVQVYAFTKYMGRLLLTFNQKGELMEFEGKPQLLDSSVVQEKDALQLLEAFRPGIEHLLQQHGTSKVVLDGSENTCRRKECNFGNLVADSLVRYHALKYRGDYWTDAPISFINGGTFRNTLESGDISVRDLFEVISYDDKILTMSLNGSNLMQVLETGVRSNGETSYGEFLQTSGLHYVVDKSRPVGKRVIEVKVRCGFCRVPVYEPLIPEKEYRIITRRFLSEGGDAYVTLKKEAYDKVYEDINMMDAVLWYINQTSPITIGEENRIRII